MLFEEADDWWDNARQRLEVVGVEITSAVFRIAFQKKYFPAHVHCKKEIEFLELKQGNLTLDEYAAKFEELVQFCSHYNNAVVKESKCIKFESGLRPEIKQGIGYQEICRFPILVNKCKIFDEDCRARIAHYKSLSDKKGRDQSRRKSYVTSADKGKHRVSYGKKTSEGGALTTMKCCKCVEQVHRANDCVDKVLRC